MEGSGKASNEESEIVDDKDFVRNNIKNKNRKKESDVPAGL